MNFLQKIILIASLFLCLQPAFVVAQTNTNSNGGTFTKNLDTLATKSGFSSDQKNNDSLAKTIGRMASITISFTATIFIIIAIYSGIQWMTAGGSKERVAEAKTRLTRSVGGFILISLAYIITTFVVKTLGN